MSSSETIRFRAQAVPAPAELLLQDHDLRTLGRGVGTLELDVPAGTYIVRARIGSSSEERLVRVSRDEASVEIRLDIPSAAPIDGTTTLNESHAGAAEELSRQPSRGGQGDGRLVLMVRDIRDVPGEPIAPADVDGVELRDARGGCVVALGDAARETLGRMPGAHGWVGFSMDLEPGGYVLHWDLAPGERGPAWGGAEAIEQSLVLPAPGETRGIGTTEWTLCVFVHRDPATGRILRESASAHLAPRAIGFHPWEQESVAINLALEAALTALRLGAPGAVVDLEQDDLRYLLGHKFTNPLLGIVGAHALLVREAVDWRLFGIVMHNLDRLVPAHPDVAALHAMGNARRGNAGDTDVDAVAVPPMLVASYRGLVARDWRERGLLEPHSLAERIGGRLVGGGPWTTWTAETGPMRSRAEAFSLRSGASSAGDETPTAPGVDRTVVDRTRAWAAAASRWAAAEGEPFALDAEQVGAALGLPPNVAARAVAILEEESGGEARR